MRVLLVDDDFWLLKGLRRVLERDYEVRVATDGDTAVSIAESFKPRAVFVDLLLSYENGLDLIEQLRETLPDATIVLMSAYKMDQLIDEALAAGADGFLAKEQLGAIGAFLWQIEKSG